MTKPFQSSSLLLAVASCFAPAMSVVAESPRPADCVASELLPKTVIAFAEVPDLGQTLESLLNHPLRSELEAMPAYDAVFQSGALGRLQAVIGHFEATMQQSWHHAITTISDRGAVIALDANESGVVILLHSSDADALERFRGFVLAARQMQGEPAKQGEYRGFIADSIGKDLKMVRMNDWLLLTSKSELGKAVVDQYLDRDQESLASNEAYVNATKELKANESDVQIVGRTQDFSEVLPQPAINLPEFAFQFRMKTPGETAPQFRRVFQSLIGFLNVVGASEGQPPLDMGMERLGEAQMITAKYLPVRGEEESLNAKIQYNFSPTLAFAGDRMIIASATSLAREMVTPAESPQEQSDVRSNTSLRFEIAALKKILQTKDAFAAARLHLSSDLPARLSVTNCKLELTAAIKRREFA